MADYTDQESNTLRNAAFSAIALVSKADSGFFDMFKESMAGSKALAAAPPEIRNLFSGFSMPKASGDMETSTLTSLKDAVAILRAKSPEQLEGYRTVITTACDEVAAAADGVSTEESATIEKVKGALA